MSLKNLNPVNPQKPKRVAIVLSNPATPPGRRRPGADVHLRGDVPDIAPFVARACRAPALARRIAEIQEIPRDFPTQYSHLHKD
ncbi:MAG: hypothetical protein ACLQJR_22940 [Stellaceae bacterium]